MTSIRLHGDLSDLTGDLRAIARETKPKLQKIVDYNAREGNKIAQTFARERSGPHGKAYYKRLTAERTGPLTDEYGPENVPKTDFVGAGFRHGLNTDLPDSADIIGPRLARDVAKFADDAFWPGVK